MRLRPWVPWSVPSMNYAAAAASATRGSTSTGQHVSASDTRPATKQTTSEASHVEHRREKRSPSPSHIPRTSSPEANVYILTLMTDKAHHDRMTQLRSQYFPKQLNKLEAHLTLFHALPGSQLESQILPQIEDLVRNTATFRISAAKPFRLKRGIAIAVPKSTGGAEGQQIHRSLQQPWLRAGFLSDQDAGGCQLHYTIMNKVDDERDVDKAFAEVSQQFKEDTGTVEGLGLWRYDRGFWRRERTFAFQHKGS